MHSCFHHERLPGVETSYDFVLAPLHSEDESDESDDDSKHSFSWCATPGSGTFSDANSVPGDAQTPIDATPSDKPEGYPGGHESIHSDERVAFEDTSGAQPWKPLVLGSSEAPFKLMRKTMKTFEKRVFVEEMAENAIVETVAVVESPGESSERVNVEIPPYNASTRGLLKRPYTMTSTRWRPVDPIYRSSKLIVVHPLPQRPMRSWSFAHPSGRFTHIPNFDHPKIVFYEGNRYTIIPSDIRTWGIQRFACPVAASLGREAANETFECLLCTLPFANKEPARSLETHFWRQHCLPISIECPAKGCSSTFTTIYSSHRHLFQVENGVRKGSTRCRVNVAKGLFKEGVAIPSDDIVKRCAATLDEDIQGLEQRALSKQRSDLVLDYHSSISTNL